MRKVKSTEQPVEVISNTITAEVLQKLVEYLGCRVVMNNLTRDVRIVQVCPACRGSGIGDYTPVAPCELCEGKGHKDPWA